MLIVLLALRGCRQWQQTSPVDEGELELAVGMAVLGDHDEEVGGGGGEERMMRSPTAVILKLRPGGQRRAFKEEHGPLLWRLDTRCSSQKD